MSDTLFYPLTVADVQPDTDASVCVTFTVPAELQDTFSFKPGQAVAVQAEVNGETVGSAYSICSGGADTSLSIGIKRMQGDTLADYANDSLKAGDVVQVSAPQGEFFATTNAANAKSYMCITVGGGIAPMLSVIKSLLHDEPNSHVTLVYGNQRTNTVMFKEELGFLKNRYMTRFSWVNIMTQEDQGSDVLNGEVDNNKGAELHKSKLIDLSAADEIFVCGEQGMIDAVTAGFSGMGIDASRIHCKVLDVSAEINRAPAAAAPAPKQGGALNFYPLTISDVQPETDTAIRVTFAVPAELQETFRFKQGQFLTLRAEINGEDVRRSYSICSGVSDGHMRVGIKRVKGGRFSNYANDNFKVGDTVEVMPPQGSFYTETNPAQAKNYMCLAVGSGITPILSIMKTILHDEPNSKVTLVYGNRRSNSVMFKEELGFIKNRYLTRFNWINIMNCEDQGADALNGRIDNDKGTELHKSKLINIMQTDDVFICGPESMMSEVSRGFRAVGFDDSRIHYELFSNSSEDTEKVLEKAQQRIETYGEEKTSKVTVISDGRAISFDLATVGENILDAGMYHGMELPYSCKAGVCSTCKAKLVQGEVDMDISHGLEKHEIDNGFILACQAHPITDEVVVDFDQR